MGGRAGFPPGRTPSRRTCGQRPWLVRKSPPSSVRGPGLEPGGPRRSSFPLFLPGWPSAGAERGGGPRWLGSAGPALPGPGALLSRGNPKAPSGLRAGASPGSGSGEDTVLKATRRHRDRDGIPGRNQPRQPVSPGKGQLPGRKLVSSARGGKQDGWVARKPPSPPRRPLSRSGSARPLDSVFTGRLAALSETPATPPGSISGFH